MTKDYPDENRIKEMQTAYNARLKARENVAPKDRWKVDCEIYQFDEVILPTIELLNNKGYFTRYSCSGHYEAGNKEAPEIQFTAEIKPGFFTNLPAGFSAEQVELSDEIPLTKEKIKAGYLMQFKKVIICRIFYTPKATDSYLRYIEILKANANLLQWAYELPEAPNSN